MGGETRANVNGSDKDARSGMPIRTKLVRSMIRETPTLINQTAAPSLRRAGTAHKHHIKFAGHISVLPPVPQSTRC